MASNHMTAGQAAAKSHVERIAKEHGYLGEAVYARMDRDTRRTVQEAMLAKDEMIGASVMLVARELYSKDVRFIFELLQNADDNEYRDPSTAYVAFRLYNRKVVIECNEDGFSEANLRAICNVGKSSKVGGHGYTGEKGIGFKSVFKVAWKVHIQSGDYSFSFTHRRGDSGMGMISPEWEDSSEQLTKPLTRITLHLFDDAEAAARRESIEQQLNGLETTMLLFLRRIKCINVHIYNDENEEISLTTMAVAMNEITHRAVLRKCRTRNGTSDMTETYCHVTKYSATGLTKSDNRDYSEAEEAAKSYRKAEIILAFPLSSCSTPIIEAQQVFAFLPIRRLGFNFLIQTDFVTMANREDIVTSASRNLALLDGIAEAFIKAIHQMYENDMLRYQWMRYLKNMSTYPWDPFWKRLVDKIDNKVRTAEMIQPRRRGSPRLIQDLKHLDPRNTDKDGNPLFEDLPGTLERYISTGYLSVDLNILHEYGLEYMYQPQTLNRVQYDLRQPNSRMKSTATNDDWHTRAAAMLNFPFEKGWKEAIGTTKDLGLLPLNDGNWVSIIARQVFFHKIDDHITIPEDLGLGILEPSACKDAQRAKLFTNLGAKYANVDDIRSRILEKYRSVPTKSPGDLETSHSHLVFLYRTHKTEYSSQCRLLGLYDTEGRFRAARTTDFYFASEDPHSLWQLSQQGQNPWFKSNVSFINQKYIQSPPEGLKNISWKKWLSLLPVRDHPRLVGLDGASLSHVCLRVAQELPSKFMGFLRYAWKSEENSVISSESVIKAMKELKVVCQGGTELRSLSHTYLPLPSLQEKCSNVLEEDFFPFLDLGESWSGFEDAGAWTFLSRHLGVGAEDNLHFYIDMLHWMREASGEGQMESPLRILGVYKRIHSKCEEASNPRAARELVQDQLQIMDLLYLPQYDDEEGEWVDLVDCILDAPLHLQSRYPVLARYMAAFPGEDLTILTLFFRDTLAIPMYTWQNAIGELRMLKKKSTSDFERIRSHYEQLDLFRRAWTAGSLNMDKIRHSFTSESLIFIQDEQGKYRWITPSECLWSSATEIRGRVSLNKYYDDNLEKFFVNILGVSRLTIDMVYDDLCGLDPAKTTATQVKNCLWVLNALLETETPKQSSQELLKKPIFPIRYPSGDVRLVSAQTDFAIVDRQPLQQQFQDKVKLLDFDLRAVNSLDPLFSWMNLKNRFLSELVKEKNSVVATELTYPMSDPVRQIRKKAHALTRVAVHLNSPRTRSKDTIDDFFILLANAETWQTDEISSVLVMAQDGASVSVEQERSEVHIADNEEPLKIYVPHDPESQDVCFCSALPERLVSWMATNPITGQIERKPGEKEIKVVTAIFGAKFAAAMDRILDKEGIINVEIPNATAEESKSCQRIAAFAAVATEPGLPREQQAALVPARRSNPSTASSSETDTTLAIRTPLSSTDSNALSRNGVPDRYYGSSSDDDDDDDNDAYVRAPLGSHAHHHNRPESFSPPPPAAARSPEHYRALLEHVVSCARATSMPRRGAVSVSTYVNRHAPQLPWGSNDGDWLLRESTTTFERDCKIGAAGELFVFELLRSLLMSFDRACWQSTMRRFVAGSTRSAGHPEYLDMEPWSGGGQRESSDIVYDDVNGVLTSLLAEHGYLDATTWAARRNVRCYIEVKSTFRECEEPFYMSDRQFRMMNELTTDQSLYMIFRVFKMTNGSIGVRIYVDPDRMRRDGLLKFSTDKWTVTPGSGLVR